MPEVNPKVLAWARETAGLTRDDATKKLQLHAARGVEPADRLAALETGADQPTRPMLVRMARSYRRPLIAFYLKEPPKATVVGTDFRTLASQRSAGPDALVRALIRDVVARQRIVRSQLEDDGADEVECVGTVAMADGLPSVLQALRQVIENSPASDSRPRTFDELREAVEKSGVYVLLQGDLGSHHTALDTTAFRGFVLSDQVAPFIVINSNDARAAWSFTLLHEMVHLLLGHTGISGADAESKVERFCNDVASEYLLPSSTVEAFAVSEFKQDQLIAALERLSNEWKVSRTLIAYRLYRSGKINRSLYRQLARAFYQQWNERRKQHNTGEIKMPYYTIRRHRLGNALLNVVERGLSEGTLPTTKAAVALGVKPTQVGQVLRMQA